MGGGYPQVCLTYIILIPPPMIKSFDRHSTKLSWFLNSGLKPVSKRFSLSDQNIFHRCSNLNQLYWKNQ